MYRIKTTPTFDKDIKKLDPYVAKRITSKIEERAKKEEPFGSFLKYLPKSLHGLRKYRIGDWRVLFWLGQKKKEIVLYGVEHRSRIYKQFR